MGQPVAVTEKPSTSPGVIRLEANRNLTGSGHERYTSVEQAGGERPSAVLARRLLETGSVDSVHVYMNVATVDVKKGHDADGLREILENLYIYYRPGFVPPSFDTPAEPEPAAAAAGAPSGAASSDALSEAAKKVPAHLLERSRAALAKARGQG